MEAVCDTCQIYASIGCSVVLTMNGGEEIIGERDKIGRSWTKGRVRYRLICNSVLVMRTICCVVVSLECVNAGIHVSSAGLPCSLAYPTNEALNLSNKNG